MLPSTPHTQPALEHFKIAFAERLTAALNKQGMNQTDLAKMLGLSRAAISRWMVEYPNISSKKLAELAQALNVSLNWLLLGVHSPERPVMLDMNCEEKQLLLLLNALEPELKDHLMQIVRQLDSKRQSTLNKTRLRADFVINGQRLPIAIIDTEGKIIYSNEYHNNLYGAAEAGRSLENCSIFDLIPSFLHASLKMEMQKTRYKGHSNGFKCQGKRLDNHADVHFTVYARAIETADAPALFAIIFPEV